MERRRHFEDNWTMFFLLLVLLCLYQTLGWWVEPFKELFSEWPNGLKKKLSDSKSQSFSNSFKMLPCLNGNRREAHILKTVPLH